MKKLLTVLLLSSSVSAMAQQWSVGLNAGGCWNSKPLQEHIVYNKGSVLGGAFSINLQRQIKEKWQVGLSVDYQRFSMQNVITDYDFDPNTGFNTGEPYDIKFTQYIPSVSFLLSTGRVFTFNRFQVYGGVSAGYCMFLYTKAARIQYKGEEHNGPDSRVWGYKIFYNGFRGGVQFGTDYTLSKHWALNANFNASYYTYVDYGKNTNFIGIEGTLGAKYKFARTKHEKTKVVAPNSD